MKEKYETYGNGSGNDGFNKAGMSIGRAFRAALN
jgi:hypothetical protein